MQKAVLVVLLLSSCYSAFWHEYAARCADNCHAEWALTPGEHVVGKTNCYGKNCTCTCVVPKSHPMKDGFPTRPVR